MEIQCGISKIDFKAGRIPVSVNRALRNLGLRAKGLRMRASPSIKATHQCSNDQLCHTTASSMRWTSTGYHAKSIGDSMRNTMGSFKVWISSRLRNNLETHRSFNGDEATNYSRHQSTGMTICIHALTQSTKCCQLLFFQLASL